MKQHVLAPEKWVTLGFGEAAAGLLSAGFLRGAGLSVCLPTGRKPSPETRRRLSECGLKATPDPAAVREASVVLSLVTPDAAREAAEMVAPFLSPATLFVDMNSIAGQTAVEIARIVEARGARFVDAAVMGPIPLMGVRVPIWLSGAAAGDFHDLATRHGLATTVLSARPGDASSLKMLWSVMTKGTIALLAESLTAAHRLGLVEPLLDLLSREYGNVGTPAMILRMLGSTAASGSRRLEEMREAAKTLEGVSVPSWAVEATVRWIAALSGMPGVPDAQTVPDVVRAVSDALGTPLLVSEKRSS